MPNIDDVPKYVRYDFFMALVGILIVYFVFTNEKINQYYINIPLLVMSASCFLYGLTEMKNNYIKDKEVIDLEREYRKIKISLELQNLNKERKETNKEE